VHGVGPSTVLGGRYAVQRRLERMAHAERWSAHDLTLERDVVIVCFGEEQAHAPATLDAARRAAGLDNARLVRVLDVGRSEGIGFFVEEAIREAHTLTQVLEQGGLPAEEARRIAGETATGLEAARSRGLHHLQLTPDSVLRASDGTVKVRGVATAAAMAGTEESDSVRASRTDAVGAVALAYAALTSRWPLPGPVAGLEAAPHVVGGVPAPSEIAAGVPGDLDALCRLTLNEDQGPITPGDFATQIAPWASTQVTSLPGPLGPIGEDTLNRTIALPVADLPRGEPAPAETPTAPIRFDPVPAANGPEPGGLPPATAADNAKQSTTGAAAASAAAAGAAGAAAASAVGSALGTASQVAGHAAEAAAQRVGTFAHAAADKAAERRSQRHAAQEHEEQRRISLNQALLEGHETLDPPLPMLPQETAQAPTRDQSKLVIAIIAAFLVMATVFAFWGVSRIGSGTKLDLGNGPTPRNTVTVTGPAATITPTHSGSSTAAPSADGYPILSATGFDPEGDNAERNGEAPRVFDGKTSTYWSSEGYASAAFGGLKKGVGVRLDLGQARKVSHVVLVLPNTEDVTVYAGQDRSTLSTATVVGSSQAKSGTVTIDAKTPVDGQYLFVWFTKVSQVSDGRYRATLAEVTVR
jgi:eukaryotic-like serine/threonine-protein kinase